MRHLLYNFDMDLNRCRVLMFASVALFAMSSSPLLAIDGLVLASKSHTPIDEPIRVVDKSESEFASEFKLIHSKSGAARRVGPRAPLRLIILNSFGVQCVEDSYGCDSVNGILVAIDGIALKGKSLTQIDELLRGPEQSEVEISFVDSNGELSKKTLRRCIKKREIISEDSARYLFRSLQDESSIVWSLRESHDTDYQIQNRLDLFIRASSNLNLDKVVALPEPKDVLAANVLTKTIITSDCIGDTKTSSRCLEMVAKGHDAELVKHLVSTGRIKQAQMLCNDLLSRLKAKAAEPDNFGNYQSLLWNALKLKVQISMNQGQNEEANEALMQMFALGFDRLNEIEQPQEWMGNAFEKLGNFKQALKCFEILRPFDADKRDGEELSIQDIGPFAHKALRLAQLQAKCKNTSSAISTLQKALTLYDSSVSIKNQELCEKIPFYSPARSDLEIELARVFQENENYHSSEKYARIAVERIERALGKNAAQLKSPLIVLAKTLELNHKKDESKLCADRADKIPELSADPDLDDKERFALFFKTLASIRENDRTAYQKNIDKLKEVCDQEVVVDEYKSRPLCVFLALLEIARMLTDQKHFEDADSLLGYLSKVAEDENLPVVVSLLRVERILNSELHAPNSAVWTNVDKENCLVQKVSSFYYEPKSESVPEWVNLLRTQENMRRLAALYSAAGYTSRADLLINRAQKLGEGKESTTLLQSTKAVLDSRVMTLLEAAVLRAKQGRISESKQLAMNAIGLCAKDPAINRRRSNEILEGLYYKTIQVAEELCKTKHDKEALEILLSLLPKLPQVSRKELDSRKEDDRSRSDDYIVLQRNSVVKAYTAKLLLAAGQAAEAYKLIHLAMDDYGKDVPFAFSLTVAEIATATKHFSESATYYLNAAKTCQYAFGLGYGQSQFQLEEKLLRRALESSALAPKTNSLTLADLYVRLATLNAHSSNVSLAKEALVFYEKADKLLSDDEPRKLELLQKIAQLKARLPKLTEKDKSVSGAADNTRQRKLSQKQQDIQNAKLQLKPAIKSAQNAEKSWRLWMVVAVLEAKAELFDDSIKHARHALALIQKDNYHISDPPAFGDDLAYSMLGRAPDIGLASALEEKSKTAEAEALFQEANEKFMRTFGAKSPQAAKQLSLYLDFLIRQNRTDEAIQLLDKILAMGIRQIDTGARGSALRSILGNANSLTENGKCAISLKILEKVLDAQEKELDADDQRLIYTFLALANANRALHNSSAAEKNLSAAYAITALYSEHDDIYLIDRAALPIYQENGKTLEVAKIQRRAASRFKLKPDVVDPRFYHENKRICALYKEWRETPVPEKMLAEYKEAFMQAPYSPRSTEALDQLLQYGMKNRDWKLVADTISKRIDIYKRMKDPYVGGWSGCTGPKFHRMSFYAQAIESNLNLGNKEAVQEWLKRTKAECPALSFYEVLQLAELEEKAGNHEQAVKYAIEAESIVGTSFMDYGNLAATWSKLGDKERSDMFYKRDNQIREKEREESKKDTDAQRPLDGLR